MPVSLPAPAVVPGLKDVARAPRPFWQYLLSTAGWCGLLVAVVCLLAALWPAAGPLTQAAFSNWDVEHYLYIKLHGYDVMRTAFFPLFPLLWQALDVSPVAMGLVNLGLFVLSFAALAWQFGWSWRQQALLLTVPSLMFMALPYSEAVFFASGVLVLVGLRRQVPALYCLGLLLSCLSRSAAFVLVPAVLATALLAQNSRSQAVRQALAGTVAALAGLGLSVVIHYYYTGRWFVFFAAQRLWDNRLQLPKLPLFNWSGSFPTRFEAPSFFIGMGCAVLLGWLMLRHWRRPLAASAAPVMFSLAYLGGVTLVTLATKGGSLASLSRYVYATPYFMVLLAGFASRVRLSSRQLLALFGLMELTWLGLFGATGHIRSLLGFTLVSAVVMLWLANAHQHPRVRRYVLLPTLLAGTALLLLLTFRFLRHEWVA